ncbi:hypothetical protein ACGFJC_47530 [Nonomuraea fuscirosea]|uniref:hypothetical protein n=1 Tax=Nonomuraea fuscirosea TaxID=1291556 RepID=UPI00370FAF34
MRIRLGLPTALFTLGAAGFLVACSEAPPACAAARVEQPAAVATRGPSRTNTGTGNQRTVPNQQTRPTAKPYTPPTAKPYTPTTRAPYMPPTSKPYIIRQQQPKPVYRTGKDHRQYRRYDGYSGWYPVGVWPYGYADQYGCTVPGQEGDGIDDLDDVFDGD